jgi:predicted transcriptional regulator
VFLAAMLISAAAWGQDGAAPNAARATNAATDAASVPDPEKLQRSANALVKMRDTLKDVLSKLEEARTSKDVVKLNCVNEKLTQIKGLLRISELADVSLQESVAKKDTATAEHEFTKVGIAETKVLQLRSQAEECIGQLAFRTDENLLVDVEEPADLPKNDPSRPVAPPNVESRPPPASPSI